jgi:hypothetical protein
MTMTEQDISCPKCGGKMWDNRATKTNPKAPDYKCRDRSCDGVVWPPKGAKNGNGNRVAAQTSTPQPISIGGPLPYEQDAAPTPNGDPFVALATLYGRCLDTAIASTRNAGVQQLGGDVASAVVAAAATLFIQANNKGIR